MADAFSPPPPQAVVPPAETPTVPAIMTLLVGVVVIAALYFGRDVFIPIVVAVLLSFVLAPFVDFLRRFRLGRVFSVIIAVLVALGIILGLASLIGTQVAQLATDLPRYQETIADKVQTIRKATIGRASALVANVGRQIEQATQDPQPAGPKPRTRANEPEKPLPVQVRDPDPTPFQLVRNYLGPVLAPFETAVIVLVVVVFILMQREDLRDRMIRLFGSSDLHRTTVAMDEAAKRLSRYFLTQLCLNAAFGVLIGAGLWLIGVPIPVLWGITAALMRFVPYIGAFIAGVLPVLLAAAVDPGWSMALMVLSLFLVSEPIMGNVVEPLVYGHSTGLSPFAVVVSAIFWTWLWGPVGLILSTPLTLCLVVLGRHVEHFEFFDVLLGDRPALTPIENFYQRVLAGDADEAQEHAEELLKERSLSSYYDEVALKGLQLAVNDATRGVLTGQQLDGIRSAVTELVEDLDAYEDKEPAPTKATQPDEGPAGPSQSERSLPKEPAIAETAPPPEERPPAWRSDTPVLCVAGRGPLDEAVCGMLSQLLHKHGLGARVVPHLAASRSNLPALDMSGVAMVCISYLEITGTPAHLRYLIRRLRQKAPDVRILVGLWPAGEAVLAEERVRKAVGADVYVTSLRDAAGACLAAVRQAGETAETSPETAEPASDRPRAPAREAVAASA
jgi:predicted PurR-regulated permease PerM